MSWREHDEDGSQRVRDEGTRPERVVGWLLAYPVRTMIAALVVLAVLTFACGL